MGIDNTQLIEIAKRPKRSKPQNSPQLERNWNAGHQRRRRRAPLGFALCASIDRFRVVNDLTEALLELLQPHTRVDAVNETA